jgi:hypothetical protein
MVSSAPSLAQYPNFLHRAPPASTYAAFVKESRMKFASQQVPQEIRSKLRRTCGTRPITESSVEESRLTESPALEYQVLHGSVVEKAMR